MKNYYPTKPMLPYKPTKVAMSTAVACIQSLDMPVEVKRSTYIVFRNESANGMKGINNNYGGIQTDSGKWPDKYDDLIIGNVQKVENGTGNVRLFAAFDNVATFMFMLADRLKDRGIYVGGDTYHVVKAHVDTPEELAVIYKREWVTGDATAVPSAQEKLNFMSMYRQAAKLFV